MVSVPWVCGGVPPTGCHLLKSQTPTGLWWPKAPDGWGRKEVRGVSWQIAAVWGSAELDTMTRDSRFPRDWFITDGR